MNAMTDARSGSTRLAALALAAMVAVPMVLPVGADPIPSFEAETVAIFCGLAAVLALASGRRDPVVGLPAVLVLPLGGIVMILGQQFAGHTTGAGLAGLAMLYLGWAAALMCVGASVRGSRDPGSVVAPVAVALVAGSLVNVGAASLQVLAPPGTFSAWVLPLSGGRPGGNLGQPNHLALQLSLGIASAGYLWLAGRWRGPAAAAMVACLAWGLALTGSRSAWLLAATLVAVALGLGRGLEPSDRRRVRGALPLFVLLFIGTQGLVRLLAAPAGTGVLPSGALISGDERFALWEVALRMFLGAPVFGQGHGAFAADLVTLAPVLGGTIPQVMTPHAHNLVLHVAAEYGTAGLGVLVGGLVLWRFGLRRSRVTGETRWALAVAALVGVASLVENPLWFAYFLGPAALALGLAEGPRLEWGLRRAGRIAWAGLAGIGAGVLVPLVSDYAFLRSLDEGVAARPEDGAVIRRVEALQRHSLLASYADIGLHRGLDFGPRQLAAKVAFSAMVVRATPLPDVTYRHALLLSASGMRDAAGTWWRRAEASYPAEAPVWARVARREAVELPATASAVPAGTRHPPTFGDIR